MGFLPVFLDVSGKRCLVVSGGPEDAGKARQLLTRGAAVAAVGAVSSDEIREMAGTGAISLEEREFQDRDLDDCLLVVDASGDPATGRRVAATARARGVLVNVVDTPGQCDFITPAVVRRGPLQLAVSTSGASPFMARRVREQLETLFGAEYGQLVELVGALRTRLRRQGVDLETQNRVYAAIPQEEVLELLRRGDVERARLLVERGA